MYLVHRTDVQCREKWLNTLDPTVNAAPYSTSEDVRLARVVYALQKSSSVRGSAGDSGGGSIGGGSGSSGAGTGGVLALEDGTDTASVYSTHLDGTNVHSLLSHTDSAIPTKWAKVAQFMPGRTDASVRSRWMLLLKGALFVVVAPRLQMSVYVICVCRYVSTLLLFL